jgi:hypothetical protein
MSIIEKRELWLTSLSLSNDSLEGRWINRLINEMCVEKDLSLRDIENIERQFLNIASAFDGLGMCFSEEPDMLSQWRGYADDACGVCIGFSTDSIEKLSDERFQAFKDNSEGTLIRLLNVEYDHETQKDAIEHIVGKIVELAKDGAFRPLARSLIFTDEENEKRKRDLDQKNKDAFDSFFELFPYLYKYKNPAFREEKEWRMFSFLYKKEVSKSIDFFASGAKLKPFHKARFECTREQPMIKEVILGPRNQTPEWVIRMFLDKNLFEHTEILFSKASYR